MTLHLQEMAAQHARAAGFDLCGVTPVWEFAELDYFPRWIDEGRNGEMEYLGSRSDSGTLKRSSLAEAVPWARSVVVCALNYNSDQPYSTDPARSDRGWISRYAWFEQAPHQHTDYHEAVLKRLREVEGKLHQEWPSEFRSWSYVDTGPVIERVLAKHAGIGWIAKNTCVINERLGSWLFLGVILTSIGIDDAKTALPADRCGSCTRCIDACPTGAIFEPYKLDARRCISYLTIEKRGTVPEELRAGMGRQVFGCDVCQDVCPWNSGGRGEKRPSASVHADFTPRPELVNPPLEWLATMSREEFHQAFRRSPIKRAKYEGLRRNAIIALGNSGRIEYIPVLERIAGEADAILAEHARWALSRLRSNNEAAAAAAEV